jgi:hypothetical protein
MSISYGLLTRDGVTQKQQLNHWKAYPLQTITHKSCIPGPFYTTCRQCNRSESIFSTAWPGQSPCPSAVYWFHTLGGALMNLVRFSFPRYFWCLFLESHEPESSPLPRGNISVWRKLLCNRHSQEDERDGKIKQPIYHKKARRACVNEIKDGSKSKSCRVAGNSDSWIMEHGEWQPSSLIFVLKRAISFEWMFLSGHSIYLCNSSHIKSNHCW